MCPNYFLRSFTIFCALQFTPFARAESPSAAEDRIAEMYKSGKLFNARQYLPVRGAFADLFQEKHEDAIRQAFGMEADELTAWLKARPKIKETLYTAVDERWDRPQKMLAVFRELWQKFPKQIEKYSNLAVATAVVWSDPALRVYDYRHHAERTKSRMRENLADAPSNFQYLVENEKIMEGRLLALPWELLVYVVDNRTPVTERGWAQSYYQRSHRLSSWHQDVPYDKGMLEGLTPRLKGRDYTLENIRGFGGVCAMQADFAARVAKSVGIPAVYCRGDSAYRGGHAWWMYVAVQKAAADRLSIRLVSDGRLAGFEKDMFYTGQVLDPRTGREMLDRDLERRLSVIGRDLAGARQADLIMRAYPWLSKRLNLDLKARVAYLDRCLKVSPYNEESWIEFARMARAGELESDAEKRIARSHLFTMCQTFAGSPDFIWRLYDDLLTVQPEPEERLSLYRQALVLFEKPSQRRADLACAARLKITQELCAQEKWQIAARGLISTIRKFPTEGRYVPQMTRKLQAISGKYKGGVTELAKLYLEVVPALREYYKGEGVFLVEMFDQAKQFLHDNDLPKYEAALKAKVGRVTREETKTATRTGVGRGEVDGSELPGLIKAITDANAQPEVRRKAAQSLSKLGPVAQVEKDIPALIEVFEDKEADAGLRVFILHVFYANQRTLRTMPQASKAVAAVLAEPKAPKNRSLRYQSAVWLAMTEGADSSEPVLDSLLDFLKDKNVVTAAERKEGKETGTRDGRVMAMKALSQIGASRIARRSDIREQLEAIAADEATAADLRKSAGEFLRQMKAGGKKK